MNVFRAIAIAAALIAAAPTAAQDKAQESPPADEPPKGDPLPDLDELLGLPKGSGPRSGEAAKDELVRKLNAQEAADAFRQAVELMGDTAARIRSSRDTSIATQRVQEDIVRKLDQIIASAQRTRSQSQSSSSSSSSQSPQNQPNQQQQQSQNDSRNGENRDERMAPALREGELAPDVTGGSEWGRLPKRIRDALLQGNADNFSTLYEKLTEAYYIRLAKEANK